MTREHQEAGISEAARDPPSCQSLDAGCPGRWVVTVGKQLPSAEAIPKEAGAGGLANSFSNSWGNKAILPKWDLGATDQHPPRHVLGY